MLYTADGPLVKVCVFLEVALFIRTAMMQQKEVCQKEVCQKHPKNLMAQPGSTSMHFKELFWSPRPRRWIQWGANWPTRLTIRSVDETWWCRGSEDIWTHPIWRSFWVVEHRGATAWQALAPRPLALTPRSRGLSRIPEQKHGKSMEKFGKGDLSEGNTVEHLSIPWKIIEIGMGT